LPYARAVEAARKANAKYNAPDGTCLYWVTQFRQWQIDNDPTLESKAGWRDRHKQLENFAEYWAHVAPVQLTVGTLESWWDSLTYDQQHNRRSYFSQFFQWGMRKGIVRSNPFTTRDDAVRLVEKKKPPKQRPALSISQPARGCGCGASEMGSVGAYGVEGCRGSRARGINDAPTLPVSRQPPSRVQHDEAGPRPYAYASMHTESRLAGFCQGAGEGRDRRPDVPRNTRTGNQLAAESRAGHGRRAATGCAHRPEDHLCLHSRAGAALPRHARAGSGRTMTVLYPVYASSRRLRGNQHRT